MFKKIGKVVLLGLVVLVAGYVWQVNINHRFETITPGKVYRSAAMPPDKIDDYLLKYHIKTVIDLRKPGEEDLPDPTKPSEIQAEAAAAAKVNVRHVSIPSDQVPTAETLSKFFAVLDDKNAYPVLIHCHDGTGRAVIYSALYRVEYEGWSDAAARDKTRPVVSFLWYRSSFADGTSKGDFLMHYQPRKLGKESTYFQLEQAEGNPAR
jgi:protein tyrosine phosphatase (PTP) superfamily phosphohydrolase (DUF442 family)